VTADLGVVLWTMDRRHPEYGAEGAELCVNLAGELLLVVRADTDDAASTIARDEAMGLRDALDRWLAPPPPGEDPSTTRARVCGPCTEGEHHDCVESSPSYWCPCLHDAAR
jgi:hypothetical protein